MQRRTLALVAIGVILAASLGAAILTSRPGTGATGGTNPVRSMDELAASYVATTAYATPTPLVSLQDVGLDVDGPRVVVRTGCNALTFSATIEDSRLVPTGPGMRTEMGCDPALMAQEDLLVAAFTQGVRLERSGPYLAVAWGPETEGHPQYSLGFTDRAWLAGATPAPSD